MSDEQDEAPLTSFEEEELSRGMSAGAEAESAKKEDFYGITHRTRASASDRRAPIQLWLISYSDFMTILLIFFLCMYGYTHMARMSLLKSQQKHISYDDFSKLVNKLKGSLGQNLEVINGVDKVVVQLREKILFQSGRANLTTDAVGTLAELANSIKLVDGDIIVQGHTDTVPVVGGPFKSNWELSAARAFSVIEALTQSGVMPERLSAWGFGENRPMAPNDKEENRIQNRRIEVVILKKKPVSTPRATEPS